MLNENKTFMCERCGGNFPIESAWNVEDDRFGHLAVCDDCHGDMFEEHARENPEPIDTVKCLKVKLSELKIPKLFRDEELITLLQAAVNEIESLRAQAASISEALNSGDGTYKP